MCVALLRHRAAAGGGALFRRLERKKSHVSESVNEFSQFPLSCAN